MNVSFNENINICQGNKATLDLIKKTRLQNPKKKIHVFGFVVENKMYDEELKSLDLDIIEDYAKFKKAIKKYDKKEDIVILSTYGHDDTLPSLLKEQGVKYIDSTCPVIKKMIKDIKQTLKKKIPVAYIGKTGTMENKAITSLSDNIKVVNPSDKLEDIRLKEGTYIFSGTNVSQYDCSRIINDLNEFEMNVHLCQPPCQVNIDLQDAWVEVTPTQYYLITLGNKDSSATKELHAMSQMLYPDRSHLIFETLDQVKEFEFDTKKKAYINATAAVSKEQLDLVVEYLKNLK